MSRDSFALFFSATGIEMSGTAGDGGCCDDLAAPWFALQFDATVFVIDAAMLSVGTRDDSPSRVESSGHASALSLFHLAFGPGERAAAVRGNLQRNTAHPLKPYIFNRSAAHVAPLIQYLRNGCRELCIDPNVSRRGVLLEAEYFGMTDVVEILRDVPPDVYPNAAAEKKRDTALDTTPCCTRRDIEASLRVLPPDVGLRLRGMCLRGISFRRLDLRHTSFELCDLVGCDFAECELSQTSFRRADATGATFQRASWCNSDCQEMILAQCNLEGALCRDTNFTGSVMTDIKATQADFSRSLLVRCDLSQAELQGTILHQTVMRHAVLHNVERSGTSLTMGGVLA
jgi:uncharacterized protein YjbI with pentapeptide repeats